MIHDYAPTDPPTPAMVAEAEATGTRPRRLNGCRSPEDFPAARHAIWFEEWDAASGTWVRDAKVSD